MRKALGRVHELLAAHVTPRQRGHVSVLNVAAGDVASRFREELEARFHPVELLETGCSPVLGAHAGPGTIGVNFYVE